MLTLTHARPATLHAAVAALLVCAVGSTAHAQNVFDDFSSGNDSAWTRVDAPGLFLGVPSTYSVVSGQYRLQNPAYPVPGTFPTGAFRPESIAGDSQISVDVTDWNDSTNNVIGLVGRFAPLSATAFTYYSLSFFPTSLAGDGTSLSNLRIDRVNPDGTFTNVTAFNANAFPRVSANDTYRLVFTLSGSSLSGELYNISGTVPTLVSSISGTDSGPGSIAVGFAGVSVNGNGTSGPADATFDNFRVVPTPGAAAVLGLGGLLAARRRR